MRTREQLAARLTELQQIMQGIVSANPVTVPKEEQEKFDSALKEANDIKAEEAELVAAEQRTAANKAALAAIQPITTRTTQSQSVFAGSTPETANVVIKSEVMSVEQVRRIPGEQRPFVLTKANGGFRSLGEQLQAIAHAGINGEQSADPRLHWGQVVPQMAITGGGTSVPSDGGYLVQKDIMTDLSRNIFNGGELLKSMDTVEIGPNSDGLKINVVDETSRATGSRWGGVQVYWGAEADSATSKKPKFRQTQLELKDLIGLAYVTERALMDASVLEQVYAKAFTEEFTFMIEDGAFNGVGGGQMLGFLNSGALVSVSKETNQAAATLVYENVLNMWSRMFYRSRMNAIWTINQDIEPQLHKMAIPVGVGGLPVYLPPGGLSQSPYATLFGRPVIPTEYNATLGTVGDICLIDPSQYVVIRKGGLTADSSIHVRFINNERTFRWLCRVDGQPKWTVPVTPAKGTATKSPFIALATRS